MSTGEATSRWRIDVRPLRESRDFRFIFASHAITDLGSMATYVAIPFQVAALTDSYVLVGLLGAVELLPLIVFGLYGGALADRVDRRTMAFATEFAMLVFACLLLVNALLPKPMLWLIFVVGGLFAMASSLQRPSIEAMTPRVVAHDQLAAAGALNWTTRNLSSILGPSLGGLLIAWQGVAAAYALDAVTFLISALLLMRVRSIRADSEAAQPPLRAIREGLAYAWSRKDLMGTYAVDLAAMALAFPFALFPFMVREFEAPWALGLLYAAVPAGAMVATLTSGWTSRAHRHGRWVVYAATVWGIAVALTGLAPNIWVVLVLLAVAGAADVVSGLFRMLIWNQTIPDELRGRMAGIEMLSYSIGPLTGQVRSTSVAAFTSLRFSLLSGGLMCAVAAGAVAMFFPALWRFDARTDPNAVRERQVRAERAAREAAGGTKPPE